MQGGRAWSSTQTEGGGTASRGPPGALGTFVPKSPFGTAVTVAPAPAAPEAEPVKLGALYGANLAELTRAMAAFEETLARGAHGPLFPVRLGRAEGGPAEEPEGSGCSPQAIAAAAGESLREGQLGKKALEASRLPAAGCVGGAGGGPPLWLFLTSGTGVTGATTMLPSSCLSTATCDCGLPKTR